MLIAMLMTIVSLVMNINVQNAPKVTFKEKIALNPVIRDITYKELNAQNVKRIVPNVRMEKHALFAQDLMFYKTETVYLNVKKDT